MTPTRTSSPSDNVPDETSVAESRELAPTFKQAIADETATTSTEVDAQPRNGAVEAASARVKESSLSNVDGISKDPKLDAEESKEAATEQAVDEKEWSIWTPTETKFVVFAASLAAFFSPVSAQIYFPALDVLAHDMHVSSSLINLSVTTYMIMQGLAPAFIGKLSDDSGRRPAYFLCFVIYIAANIGLALQNSYPALMVLRCVQSAGSSGTVALASAVVADTITSSERGIYIAYTSVAPMIGPSLGPVIGGLLTQYLGWQAIFWFLAISAGVLFVPFILFFPETCRKIVGDGSIPPLLWNRSLLNNSVERKLIREGKTINYEKRDELAKARRLRFPNPFDTIYIVFQKEVGFALGYNGIVLAAFYATAALMPSQFARNYGFNELQLSLCYIPLGFGSIIAAFTRGRMIDSRFKYHARKLGISITSNRRIDLTDFPIERARLEVAIPTIFLGAFCTIGFGWTLDARTNLAGPLILLFFLGFSVSSTSNTVSVLAVDIYPEMAATATAANNIVRCWMGAGATALVVPMINAWGVGWTGTFLGLMIIFFSPMLWYIMRNGPTWRKEAKEKRDKKAEKKLAHDLER